MEIFHGEEAVHCILACTLVASYLTSRLDVPMEELDEMLQQNAEHMKALVRKARAIRQSRMM